MVCISVEPARRCLGRAHMRTSRFGRQERSDEHADKIVAPVPKWLNLAPYLRISDSASEITCSIGSSIFAAVKNT